ncbi:MAG: DHH family phosphoesterase [Coriobacteriia bacterium]|nr:DHH family phosphoesterase [Coriobacteriia bacterium]
MPRPMSDHISTLTDAARALTSAGTVVVCAHVHPDGDAVGATLGAVLALRSLGIEAVPTLADGRTAPATYAFLPGHDLYRTVDELAAPDVFLALDCPNWSRLGDAEALARSAGAVVVVDHHPDNTGYGHINVVDAAAAASGQIIWRMLPDLGVKAARDVATCLYVAIMTDTGRFSYGNTDANVLRVAAEMVDAGVDAYHAYSAVYEARSASYLRLLGVTLSRITHANAGRVAYTWITDDDLATTGTLPEETEDLVDMVRTVGDVEAVALFKPDTGSTRVSLRAKAGFDVGAAARALGGGGHHAASGATVAGGLDDALMAVLPLLPGGSSR